MISFIVLTCSSKHTRAAERRRRWSGCWTVWRSLTLNRGEEVQRSAAVWGGSDLWPYIWSGLVVTWLETFKSATFTFRMNTPPPSSQKKTAPIIPWSSLTWLQTVIKRSWRLSLSGWIHFSYHPIKTICNDPLAINSRYYKTHAKKEVAARNAAA